MQAKTGINQIQVGQVGPVLSFKTLLRHLRPRMEKIDMD